jgi:hypothetical protein
LLLRERVAVVGDGHGRVRLARLHRHADVGCPAGVALDGRGTQLRHDGPEAVVGPDLEVLGDADVRLDGRVRILIARLGEGLADGGDERGRFLPGAVLGLDEKVDVLDGVADAPGGAVDGGETLVVGGHVAEHLRAGADGGDGVEHLVAEDAVEDDHLVGLAGQRPALAAVLGRADTDESAPDSPADERVRDQRTRPARREHGVRGEHRVHQREGGHEAHPRGPDQRPQRDHVDVPRLEGGDGEADAEGRECEPERQRDEPGRQKRDQRAAGVGDDQQGCTAEEEADAGDGQPAVLDLLFAARRREHTQRCSGNHVNVWKHRWGGRRGWAGETKSNGYRPGRRSLGTCNGEPRRSISCSSSSSAPGRTASCRWA